MLGGQILCRRLNLVRGIVSSRVVLLLRSAEIKPLYFDLFFLSLSLSLFFFFLTYCLCPFPPPAAQRTTTDFLPMGGGDGGVECGGGW